MRPTIISMTILLLTVFVYSQERQFKPNLPVHSPFSKKIESAGTTAAQNIDFKWAARAGPEELAVAEVEPHPLAKVDDQERTLTRAEEQIIEASTRFRWRPALIQSFLFLGIQHGFRMTEAKTRDELDGPFFRDWKESVQGLRGWDDGGRTFTNYVAHPMQGAITGHIFINNSGSARYQHFGLSKDYWTSRLKVLAWSAVWSTQFEIGPISEASLGNVGQKPAPNGRSKMTWGDLVITPTVGTAFVIMEDAIDRFILRDWLERKIGNRLAMKILRSVFTPMQGFANILRGRAPWRRDARFN